MLRRLLVGTAAAALFIGCLFPSFDDLKSNDVTSGHGSDDDDDTEAGVKKKDAGTASSSGTTSSSGQSSTSSSGGVVDSGPDTSTPQAKTIKCGDKTCDVTTQVCCDEAGGGTACNPKNAGCGIWTFTCDDFTDCPDGQLCCGGGGSFEVGCANSCDNVAICNDGKPCKSGSCGGGFIGPPNVRIRVCQ